MRSIEILDIKEKNGASGGITERKVFRQKDYEDFQEWLRGIKLGTLVPNKNVYFHEGVVFPRKKFKAQFPENKMVYSPEKAALVVIDKKALEAEFNGYVGFSRYVLNWDGTYTDEYLLRTQNSGVIENFPSSWRVGIDCSFGVKINELLAMDGKTFVDVSSVSLPSEHVLDKEAISRIEGMLSSHDSNMVNMALNLLTAYDYSKEKSRIVMLLVRYKQNLERSNKKYNVEIKSMLRKLNIDFPGYRNRYMNEIGFYLRLAAENPDDLIIRKTFNDHLRHVMPGFPPIKIAKE